ncbi:hypothetical protein DAPPUDRAFT_235888 [Daphnia pulex]|uniref:Uncharacterized protein n=1 Tax=Daphnia pulex TaxID=6669 RepID=E9FZB5_DAPPU|nr:hypothetical protein DAPPUDRAFT_235888 [Daphnia pulex]|eukprot:EFX87292.1 hypothetical protein DAPPUDRAFT_235888 [Daphnia pulex]
MEHLWGCLAVDFLGSKLTSLPSIRFEFIGGSPLGGSKAAKAAFSEGYNKRRTDEHAPYASLKGSGTGNAVSSVWFQLMMLRNILLEQNGNLF